MILLLASTILSLGSALHLPLLQSLSQYQKLAGPEVCITLHCPLEMGACVINSDCRETLECMAGCSGRPDESQCQFECEMTLGNGNEPFQKLLECMAANDCFPEVPDDGRCLAASEDTVQEVTSIEDVSGDWWVVKGVNCGQDDVWRGGYDWYPCQHERYLRFEDGWINNTTYSGGSNSDPTTEVIVTVPHATLPSPGLIRLEYDDEPLLPQIERWHIMSYPEENYMMVFWCGTNPALDYNGGFVLSRTRTINDMLPETEAEFRRIAELHGVDYDAMCVSDNTNCEL